MENMLWQPSDSEKANTNIARFIAAINAAKGYKIQTYGELHRVSVEDPDAFWDQVWDFCTIKAQSKGSRVQVDPGKMPGTRFFPDARLNYAENLLRRRDDSEAIVFRGEDKVSSRMTWAELYDGAARANRFFRESGISTGDRVAAMLPNMPETIIAMLGATALGAVWSSCSPDFGERGVLDRFGQIDPKILLVCDGYYYNGKWIDIADKVNNIAKALPSVERIVVIPYQGPDSDGGERLLNQLDRSVSWRQALGETPGGDIEFVPVGFNDPLYILFSSGTTGAPKCIVHSVGGTLITHLKEHQLQCDLKPGEKLFYFTTCGWMMWNWLVSALASEATLCLFDGSPFAPDGNVLFDYSDAERFDVFGTSAKYIDSVKKSGLRPRDSHDLGSVRLILSTGSPLAPESFDFVYDAIKGGVQLASMSGGTDICGCFVGGDPTGPVWRGEIQAGMLGMAVDVWGDDGRHLNLGKGELVCTKPFPSMPIGFLNDPDGARYRSAYFELYPNIWCQGDFAEWTEHGGIIIHGRSDATLNPGGVRIGTAEIYAQVEQMPEIVEAIAIGQNWDSDVRVVLFVRLAEGVVLDEDLIKAVKQKIRTGASPRHVPAKVIAVADIPRTKSGQLPEIPVRDIVHGRQVKNKEALANPEALDLFRDLSELAS